MTDIVIENKVVISDETIISVGSEDWFQWIDKVRSFKYEPHNYEHVVKKAVRVVKRKNGKWYAVRNVTISKGNYKQRCEYLGDTDDVDYERLQNVVDVLSLKQSDYLQYKENEAINRKLKIEERKKNTVPNRIKTIAEKVKDKEPGYVRNSAKKLMQDILNLAEDV